MRRIAHCLPVTMDIYKMYLVLVIQSALVLNQTTAKERRRRRSKEFVFSDCGNRDSAIQFLDIGMRPFPIRLPGRLKTHFAVNITRNLPESISADVKITRFLGNFKYPMNIPCFFDFGSCFYKDICAFLTNYDRLGCPRMLAKRGIPCHCPFQKQLVDVERITLELPELEGFPEFITTGEYESTVRLLDANTSEQLGCLSASFSIRPRKRETSFRRKRARRRQVYEELHLDGKRKMRGTYQGYS